MVLYTIALIIHAIICVALVLVILAKPQKVALMPILVELL